MMTYLDLPCLLTFDRMEAIREIDIPEGLEIMCARILLQIYKQAEHPLSLRLTYSHASSTVIVSWRKESWKIPSSREKGASLMKNSASFPICRCQVVASWRGFSRAASASVHDYFKAEPQRKADKAQSVPRSDSRLDLFSTKSTFSDILARV